MYQISLHRVFNATWLDDWMILAFYLFQFTRNNVIGYVSILGGKCRNNTATHIDGDELVSMGSTAIPWKPISPVESTHTPNPHLAHI